MIDRRAFIGGIGAYLAILSLPGGAQLKTARRIGVLSPGPPLDREQIRQAWAPLRGHGWIEGENLIFERRWASGRADQLRPLAEELVALKVEIIATIGMPATLAAKAATASIPIVMLSAGDPVGNGLVKSLARPGGNVTGYSTVAPELAKKRIALLHDLAPSVQRIALLFNPTNYLWDFSREQNDQACRSLGLEPMFFSASSDEQLESAIAELVRRRSQAIVVDADALFYRSRAKIMGASLSNGWPSVVSGQAMVEPAG